MVKILVKTFRIVHSQSADLVGKRDNTNVCCVKDWVTNYIVSPYLSRLMEHQILPPSGLFSHTHLVHFSDKGFLFWTWKSKRKGPPPAASWPTVSPEISTPYSVDRTWTLDRKISIKKLFPLPCNHLIQRESHSEGYTSMSSCNSFFLKLIHATGKVPTQMLRMCNLCPRCEFFNNGSKNKLKRPYFLLSFESPPSPISTSNSFRLVFLLSVWQTEASWGVEDVDIFNDSKDVAVLLSFVLIIYLWSYAVHWYSIFKASMSILQKFQIASQFWIFTNERAAKYR